MCRRVSVIVAAPAHQLQTGHRLLGAGPVGLLDDEPHVDDHPVTGCKRLLRENAAVDVRARVRRPATTSLTASMARGTAAATTSLRPMPSSTLSASQPMTTV